MMVNKASVAKKANIQTVAVLAHLRKSGKAMTQVALAKATKYPPPVVTRIIQVEGNKVVATVVGDANGTYRFADSAGARRAHDDMLASYGLKLDQALVPGLTDSSIRQAPARSDAAAARAIAKAESDAAKAAARVKIAAAIASEMDKVAAAQASVAKRAPKATPKAKAKPKVAPTQNLKAATRERLSPRSVQAQEILGAMTGRPMTFGQIMARIGDNVSAESLQLSINSLVEQGRLSQRKVAQQVVYSAGELAKATATQDASPAPTLKRSGGNLSAELLKLVDGKPRPPKYFSDALSSFPKPEVSKALKLLADSGKIKTSKAIKPIGYLTTAAKDIAPSRTSAAKRPAPAAVSAELVRHQLDEMAVAFVELDKVFSSGKFEQRLQQAIAPFKSLRVAHKKLLEMTS